ncbi:hypothetical protein H6504_02890 [Candidatus Woesearchaeota archaeon]|nr:hypothetical protein [Candidatus Woesearchaeota archaeon]
MSRGLSITVSIVLSIIILLVLPVHALVISPEELSPSQSCTDAFDISGKNAFSLSAQCCAALYFDRGLLGENGQALPVYPSGGSVQQIAGCSFRDPGASDWSRYYDLPGPDGWTASSTCQEGIYRAEVYTSNGICSLYNNYFGSCQIEDVQRIIYDDNEDVCMNCNNPAVYKNGIIHGIWADIPGQDMYKGQYMTDTDGGTCCGDDPEDDPDWHRDFCLWCSQGDNAPDFEGYYSGYDDESPRAWDDAGLCCGDDDSPAKNITANDCGRAVGANTLCWDRSVHPALTDDLQTFIWESPSDTYLVDFSCDNPNENIHPNYRDDSISMLADGGSFYRCDRSSFSNVEADPAFEEGTRSFIHDIPNPYDGSVFLCAHSRFSGNSIGFINGGSYSEVIPKIYACSDGTYWDYENAFIGGVQAQEGDTMPYASLARTEPLKLDQLFYPDSTEGIFPRFSSVDAVAFIDASRAGTPNLDVLEHCTTTSDCLLVVKGTKAWAYNTKGELKEGDITEIHPQASSISALTQDANGYLFGVGNIAGSPQYFFRTGRLPSQVAPLTVCNSEAPAPADVYAMSVINSGHLNVLAPTTMIFSREGSTNYIYEFQARESGSTSDACAYTKSAQADIDFDAIEAIQNEDGEDAFRLPAKTGAFIGIKDDEFIYQAATPIHCVDGSWTTDIDNMPDPYAAQECSGIGKTFKEDLQCCGDPLDVFEISFKDVSFRDQDTQNGGICYLGEWQNSYGKLDTFQQYDSIPLFFLDHALSGIVNQEIDMELDELILEQDSFTEFKGCAIVNDDSDNVETYYEDPDLLSRLQRLTSNSRIQNRPYQGGANTIYNSEFDGYEMWEFMGGLAQPSTGSGELSFKVDTGSTEPAVITQTMHQIRQGETYNFNVRIKAESSAGEGKSVKVFFGTKDSTSAYTTLASRNIVLHKVSGTTDHVYEAVLTFTPNAVGDKYDNHYVIGLDFEKDASLDYTVTLIEPVLASNDYLLDTFQDNLENRRFCSFYHLTNQENKDYYCSFREVWEKTPAEYKALEEEDFVLKTIPEEWLNEAAWDGYNSPDYLINYTADIIPYAPDGMQVAECCPIDHCWTGSKCVPPDNDQGRPTIYPNPEIRHGYRCVYDEEEQASYWQEAHLKWDWDNNDQTYGYCLDESQCLVDFNGVNYTDPDIDKTQMFSYSTRFSTSAENKNPICIDDGEFIQDHLCRNGEWESRTQLVAEQMLGMAQNFNTFTFYCDSIDNTLNYEYLGDEYFVDPYVIVNQRVTTKDDLLCEPFHQVASNPEYNIMDAYIFNKHSAKPNICYTECSYGDGSYPNAHYDYPCVNNVCVLSYKDGDTWKNIIGTSLNQPFEPPRFDPMNYPLRDLLGNYDVDATSSEEYDIIFFTNRDNNIPGSSADDTLIQSIFNIIKQLSGAPGQIVPPRNATLAYLTELAHIYVAQNDGNLMIQGGTTSAGIRNAVNIETGQVDPNVHPDTRVSASHDLSTMVGIDYTITNRDDFCQSLYGTDAWGPNADSPYQNCRADAAFVEILGHETGGARWFYQNIWHEITGKLRPGR